jgi:hypothetical protein
LHRCLQKINIYFNLVKRGSNLTFNYVFYKLGS